MRRTFNNAIAVAPFGSYVTGLYLPTSDNDIVLALPQQWHGLPTKIQLSAISTAIKASGFASHVDDVLNASVPLIKIRDQITSIDIDLTAFDGHAFRSTGLVQKWMQKDTELKTALMMVLKRFLAIRRCGTTYTGGINSYLLVWMVVAWVHIEWPNVKRSAPSHIAATSINTPNNSPVEPFTAGLGPTNATSVHLLPLYTHALLHFFRFYGPTFRYEFQAIEIEPTPRIRYKLPTPKRPYLFSISDPADPSIDMGSKVYGIKHIQATFSHAYVALQQITRVLELGDGQSTQFPHGILHYLLYIS
ncbi:hypothetical protein D9619_008492 [Psilocybe cf. subviscida]|uniref:polynucleotide adenylyltransferase n=1 Tax=Psilocybe cf. subviscida TaxID=2480587 RepID=A0A8H5BAB4_9AGAR|nr:hypothetical protein D9619_008492 [Psilocybe cf. subviscida]